MDIGILFGSQSVENFVAGKQILQNVLKTYDYKDGNIRIGLISYGKDPVIKVSFKENIRKSSLLQLVENLIHPDDGLRLDKALTIADTEFFKPCLSETLCTSDTSKSLIIFTDKQPNNRSIQLANNIASKNVKLVTVITGSKIGDDVINLGGTDAVTIPKGGSDDKNKVADKIKDSILPGILTYIIYNHLYIYMFVSFRFYVHVV